MLKRVQCNTVTVFDGSTEDCQLLLGIGLKPDDERELALGGHLPTKCLVSSYLVSEDRFLIFTNDRLLGAAGVTDISEYFGGHLRTGSPWFLSSTIPDECRFDFLKASREMFSWMTEDYDLLVNYTWSGHRSSHKWLQWMGFSFIPSQNITKNGEVFDYFEWRK